VRILIIDDEPAMHDAYRRTLGASQAGSARGALAAMASELFADRAPGTDADADSEEASFRLGHAMQGRDGAAMVQEALR
jgi:hypothetical protein